MTRMRTYPKKVINAICTKLNVKSAEKQEIFGEVIELLNVYNAKPQ